MRLALFQILMASSLIMIVAAPSCDDEADGGASSGGDGDGDGDADGDADMPAKWARLSGGTFTMGSPASEEGRYDDETQHQVTLTRDYEIQTTEVTQSQFKAVMGYDPSDFGGCGDCPVETVRWYEAAAYCNALSDLAILDRCYDCSGSGFSVICEPSGSYSSPYDCPGYRLPTEAEWEYAARSGTTGASYADLDDVAWYHGNSGVETHPVGSKNPSPWGLHDMLGNVWEWCHDWHDDYPSGSVTDPWGPETGSGRLLRGGSAVSHARYARAAGRTWPAPGGSADDVGFRPVRSR